MTGLHAVPPLASPRDRAVAEAGKCASALADLTRVLARPAADIRPTGRDWADASGNLAETLRELLG